MATQLLTLRSREDGIRVRLPRCDVQRRQCRFARVIVHDDLRLLFFVERTQHPTRRVQRRLGALTELIAVRIIGVAVVVALSNELRLERFDHVDRTLLQALPDMSQLVNQRIGRHLVPRREVQEVHRREGATAVELLDEIDWQ